MRRWLSAGFALALGACAHVPPADDGLELEARHARLERVAAWEMRGRLAVETADDAHLARFRWVQNDDALLLNVRGPFGAGSFEIEGAPPALTVTSRGETWQLTDAESELSARLGWWLPLASLESWLLGMPDPGFDTSSSATRGNVLESLEQRRWTVRFPEYMLAEGLLVPREIEFRHRDLRIDLTIDEWSPRTGARARRLN